jgi:ATP-dependent DNA ligase
VVLDGEWYNNEYHVFDLAHHPGTLEERRAVFGPIVMRLSSEFPIQLMPRWHKLGAYARALAEGLEGIVLKHRSHRYGLTTNQTTTPLWRKVKP